MSTQFRDQGGAASSDPSWLRRTLTSLMMRRLADPVRRQRARDREERRRRRAGDPHRVQVFFQLDDPYSHLAAQMWAPLLARYDIVIEPWLVSGATDANTPEPALLADYARRDCARIASQYGLLFDPAPVQPAPGLVALARRILAKCDSAGFIARATRVSSAMWAGDGAALQALAVEYGCAPEDASAARVAQGNVLRARLGHYAGAMFHYGGEWYWGVDRLHHLERRLLSLGASREPTAALLAPRPRVEPCDAAGRGLRLEFYASLRSPYTAVAYEQAVALATACGVRLDLKPVLPMVMRGVPVTVQKGRYIFFDAGREAEDLGVSPWHPRDPIGEPVRKLYALLPWALAQGRGAEVLGAGLRAAFREGLDVADERVLRRVVESAGLDWTDARGHRGDTGWEDLVEQNRIRLYASGIWGVPAFRLMDAGGAELLSAWGQDRLWLVAQAIAAHR